MVEALITLVSSATAGTVKLLFKLTTIGQVSENSISTSTASADGLIMVKATSPFNAFKASKSTLYHLSTFASKLMPLVISNNSASWQGSGVSLIISTLKVTALSVVISTYTSVTSSLTILSMKSNNCSGTTTA